ncbi:effector of transcription2 [Striga asiatica]|uniref:Effector of transcription2 n=1 Tax=Striga asiatica TaxID=4170 RepID=A0A5A7R205_STRAF|nr:effector of transcription2 [Striga asiatica]
MGAPSSATSSAASTGDGKRLRREDFKRTKHDSAFSRWKILIGPSDWEDYSMAKEGVEKYRTQNLPKWTSCSGVYELGVAASRPKSGRGAREFKSSSVVPVYLGQADNLRNRLQQYGRDGAHLENGCLNLKFNDCQTSTSHNRLGWFADIFSRGLPILYRCAPVSIYYRC